MCTAQRTQQYVYSGTAGQRHIYACMCTCTCCSSTSAAALAYKFAAAHNHTCTAQPSWPWCRFTCAHAALTAGHAYAYIYIWPYAYACMHMHALLIFAHAWAIYREWCPWCLAILFLLARVRAPAPLYMLPRTDLGLLFLRELRPARRVSCRPCPRPPWPPHA